MSDVLSGFANVGASLQDDSDIKELQNRNSNEVTMGVDVPRQNEGKVGDITVRDIASIGLAAYIKTNSGWYDINSMRGQFKVQWIKMNLTGNWAHSSSYNEPAYFKDEKGFVHLRGGLVNASGGGTDDIFTLPAQYAPPKTMMVAAAVLNGRATFKITSTGTLQFSHGASTSLSFMDGISFYANQPAQSSAQGGSGGGSNTNRGIVT